MLTMFPTAPTRIALERKLNELNEQKHVIAYNHRVELAFARYLESCATLQHTLPATHGAGTIAYLPVCAYAVGYIARQKGSTRSLDIAISNLRVYCTRENIPWLDASDAYLLRRSLDLLKLEDFTPGRQAEPFTRELLLKIVSLMDLKDDEQLMQATLAFVGHDAFLRGGELFGAKDLDISKDRRLRVRNFRWSVSRRSVILRLVRTKTAREGCGADVELVDPGHHIICGVSLLRKWFSRRNLWNQPDAFVFPQFIHRRRGTSTTAHANTKNSYSKDMFIKALRVHLVTLGLDPLEYRGHSLRSGAATDAFNMNVPLATIM